MNKKGFTLTELLVVVVILGIIAGMAIPLIRSLSGTFTKKKYENYKDSVLSAAKLIEFFQEFASVEISIPAPAVTLTLTF